MYQTLEKNDLVDCYLGKTEKPKNKMSEINDLTWKAAIDIVLNSSSVPLHYEEITEKIIENDLKKILGATPSATVSAQISSSIKHLGEKSPYIRTGKGTFTLKNKNLQNISDNLSTEDEICNHTIITSFGMFWNRDYIIWSPSPRLLGTQQPGSSSVDFHRQIGVYLLYDGREIIYVGRSIDRPLGRRLYEHTIDRLSSRWNRFSWFGIIPLNEDGSFGKIPDNYSSTYLVPTLESILIESIEPRQNRKRGDDLLSFEYMQKIDPEIERRKVMAALDEALKTKSNS